MLCVYDASYIIGLYSWRSIPHLRWRFFEDFRVNIWDASGDLKFQDVRNEFYKEAQAVILVFDVTSRRSFQNLEKWMDEVAKFTQGQHSHM